MNILGYHLTYTKNLKKIFKFGIKPNVPEDMPEDPCAVYLFIDLESLENALINWFGERLDEDEEFSVLVVDLSGVATVEGAEFEHVVPTTISPNRIVKIMNESDFG